MNIAYEAVGGNVIRLKAGVPGWDPSSPLVTPVHTGVKGRARLRVAGLYRDRLLKSAIESGLRGRAGITQVAANELTGNVLVYFDPSYELQRVIVALEQLLRIEGFSRPPIHENPSPDRSASSSHRHRSDRQSQIEQRLRETPPEAQKFPLWHLADADETLAVFKSSKKHGLTSHQAQEALNQYGPNTLPETAPRSALSLLLGQFQSLPVALLGVSATISVLTGGLADAAVILAVVLINAGLGFITESQADRTIHALTGHVRRPALLLRDGKVQEVPAEQVVVGDVLVLAPGSFVAADARLIEARNLTIDESALTGESQPVLKSPARLTGDKIPLADRVNMVYRGTMVTGGGGLAVVVATARHTEMGIIQSLVGETQSPETPMQKQLDQLGNQLVLVSVAVCGVVFVVGLLRGYGFLQMLRTAVSLAVAAVPEGLPTVATTTLALGIREMGRRKVLIRQLSAVETLGAVQVICLDKTGTLTLNRMSVIALHVGMEPISVVEGRLALDPGDNEGLLKLLHVGVLCNETEVNGQKGDYVLNGSATESALVQLALDSGIAINQLRRRYRLVKVDYRAENRNYMCTWHQHGESGQLLAVKGSPGEVLDLCRWYLQDGVRRELTDSARLEILNENERMAGDALRVLGFAYAEGEGLEPTQKELTWLGLAGMADPIRPGVKALMERFHGAGIKTIMITGDQSGTAYAIGRELGLSGGERLEILDSSHLERLDPQVLSSLAQRADIFARVSPANKLQIVQGLQQAGRVVAMTGDGVNDGPALKAADIGIAMGHGGTEVARSVAAVVLEDDQLETMIVAVSQGRTIYSNIRKSVHFLVSTNLSEIAVMLGAIGAGLGQPLNAMQLLWINLLTDIFPALALSMEPPEPDVLRQTPRDPQEPIIRKQDLGRFGFESLTITAGTMASYGYGLFRYGLGPQANTLTFMTLSLAQLLHSYSCRSETHGLNDLFSKDRLPTNHYLNLAIGGSLALQLLSVFLPGLRTLLGTTRLTFTDGLAIAGGAAAPFILNEMRKGLSRLTNKRPGHDQQPLDIEVAL